MNHNAIVVLIYVLSLFTRANAICYGWGKNDQGQLGIGSQTTQWAPTLIPFYNNINVLNVLTATNYHMLLAQNGSAYASGLQFYGQFANGYTSTTPILTPINCPSLNSSLDISLAGMACNANMNTNLLGWGNLAGYVQGKTTGTAPKIQTAMSSYKFDAKVVSVNSVMEGTIVRLANNTVWVAGVTGSGRLGINTAASTLYNFTENTFWRNVSIKQFFSSQSAHACALAVNGSLYCWGQNTYGQLGVGDNTNRVVPTRVTFFEKNYYQVYKVAYGDSHTAVLTCGGKLFTFGSHSFGQLGTTAVIDNAAHPVPTEVVDTRWQGTAADVVTGTYQTFIRTTSNLWYVWGSSNYGALGLGSNTNNQATPVYNPNMDGLNKVKSSSQSLNFFGWYDSSVTNDKPGCNLVNECAIGTAACDKNAVCSDLEIGYYCTCRPGWTGDGFSTGTGCQDAYSCDAIGDECVPISTCDDSTGYANCICPPGYTGDGRINNATVNGTGCDDINECTTGTPCASNAYCTNLVPSYNCTCNPGYYGDAYGSGCLIECQPGQYSKGINQCEDCAEGTYSDTYQAPYCTPCPVGTYADVTGTNSSSNCKKCPTGGYSNWGARYCKLCDYGYTNDPTQYYPDNSTCFGCPLGTYGYYGQCYPCAVGQYSIAAVAQQCLYCPPGYYNTQQASLSCIKCPAGYISKGGSSTCTICPAGHYSTAGSQDCLKCPPGTSTNGNSGQSSCSPCDAGYYSPKAASITCSPCGNGFYTNSSGYANCLKCPQGSYSVGVASTFCSVCPTGSFVASTGGTQCFTCSAGSVVSDGINCIPCNAGTYFDSTTSTCKPCAPGAFVAVTGATSCFQCAAGYYADASGALVCKRCDVNTYSDVGATICTACPTGKKSPGAAAVCS